MPASSSAATCGPLSHYPPCAGGARVAAPYASSRFTRRRSHGATVILRASLRCELKAVENECLEVCPCASRAIRGGPMQLPADNFSRRSHWVAFPYASGRCTRRRECPRELVMRRSAPQASQRIYRDLHRSPALRLAARGVAVASSIAHHPGDPPATLLWCEQSLARPKLSHPGIRPLRIPKREAR